MIRARKLVNELNIKLELLAYFSLDIQDIYPNLQIDVPTEKRIRRIMEKANFLLKSNSDETITDIESAIKYVTKSEKDSNNNINAYPEEFSEINEFEHHTAELIQNKGNYDNRKLKNLIFDNQQINSIFTDFEASSICLGLTDKHSKFLARKFFNSKVTYSEIYELHILAMKTYSKYGSDMISFILTLPPLPFKVKNYQKIFAELDKMATKQSFPVLRFSFKNQEGKNEKVNFTFYSDELTDKKRKPNSDIVIIKNRTTGKTILKITRSGLALPSQNAKNIIPILDLYINVSENPRKAMINYGLATGECSICGRELTDSASIKRGVGPVCASYL